MSAPSDTRPPSPPNSLDGDRKVITSTQMVNALQLRTPPGPMMPAVTDDYPYDVYGDPVNYHTATQQVYYTHEPYALTHPYYQTQTPPPAAYADSRIQTRSGRSLGSPQSPRRLVTRRAQSPKKRPAKKRAGKGKPGGPVMNEPLSELTKDYTAPVRDMEAWVNRPAEARHLEAEKKNGYISRPMNSFMLYRSAYAERVKQFCKENNHQVVSQVTGASWPLEPESIRKEYERMAIVERDNHAAAHPHYKFAPNKAGKKRARADEDEDSDGEWGGSVRSTKRSRTVGSSRYGDSRSNTGTPFDPDRAHYGYSPQPAYQQLPVAYNASAWEARYSHAPPPQYMDTYGMQGQYMIPRAVPYAPNVEDVHFDRHHAAFPTQQEMVSSLVGMPSMEGHGLLAPESEVAGVNVVDPALSGQSYEGAVGYGHSVAQAYHPGQATLTDGWAGVEYAGADFEKALRNM